MVQRLVDDEPAAPSGLDTEHSLGEDGSEAPAPDAPTTTHPTIRRYSRGEAVVEAQTKLNAHGADPPLEPDGIFGPLTQQAVVAFQSRKGLEPDGVIGPLTWGWTATVWIGSTVPVAASSYGTSRRSATPAVTGTGAWVGVGSLRQADRTKARASKPR